jgi:outer membrane protein TolC
MNARCLPCCTLPLLVCAALAQTTPAPSPATPPAPAGPLTITLQDAFARARQYAGQIQSANFNVAQAREDRVQARANTLPSVNAFNQYIYTEGNGTPSGVFVANDGVHVYNEQAVVHQEVFALVRHGEINRAMAAEAVARAKADVAARGLNFTIAQDYYAIVSAQRKFVNAQTSLREADQFLDITQKQEKGGEAAHADVVKAQITQQQRQRDVQDAQLAIDKARIALGVLIFPDLRSDYNVEDDIAQPAMLPPLPEAQAKATNTSPDLQVAKSSIEQSVYDVAVARYQYLPSLAIDVFYGIDANQFAVRTDHPTQDTGRSTLPNYSVPYRQNLGYVAQATLNIPVWNWGAIRSKVKQAALKQQQAELDLTLAQRTLQGNIAAYYREAQTAQAQIDSLRQSSDLSAESLRLTLLRYQAGEANALEVVDAQTTLTQARNAYDDGLVRYRVALANLQTLTGN